MTAQLKAIPQEDYDPLVHETPLAGYPVMGGDIVKVERDGDTFTVQPAQVVVNKGEIHPFGKFAGVALFPAKLDAPVVILTTRIGTAVSADTIRLEYDPCEYVLVVSRDAEGGEIG